MRGSLFFSSDGHLGIGMLDIFGTVTDKAKNIITVINLGIPVNSSKDDFSFFMNEDGISGYFASNRNEGIGSDDIYGYDRVPQLLINGVVTDFKSNVPISNAMVTVLYNTGNKIADILTDENGHYDINVDRDTDYLVNIKKDDYVDDYKRVTSKNIDKKVTSITTNFALNSVEKTEIITETELAPIYFDFNKASIRENSTEELDKIINLMLNVHPKMVIKIQSFTDSRGTSSYNDKLSLKRAQATFKYLVSNGVESSRISESQGYGEKNLINNCDDASKCSEEQHQLNRRTQFIVIKEE